MRAMVFALSVACVASPAAAADWRIVSWNDEFVLRLDSATIRHAGPIKTYQSRVLYLKDPVLAQLETKVEMDCRALKYRNISVSALFRSGKAETTRARKDWRRIVPGTNAEREFLIVCVKSPLQSPR